ncbi:DUF4296 domain-containing protein [Pontibacter mangrovi]|uniref:DUF4296 domain-containing protein n=1 Tax=Pontibacter mangrovi TaxID=2589816 RepID=A0A501W8P9_9BACT|nr:DUF4296 domain-containing protein [Pontibacter mangrovi]TPE45989.1 DUF4296 domain-containing protein [Pontibacter mangrovi]
MKKLFNLLFCLGLFSCNKPEESRKPENMIPKGEMVRILADIHTTEALIEANIIHPDTAIMVFNTEQERILKNHDVTEEQFKSTYNYYLTHLSEMDALYEEIVDTLSVRESKAKLKKEQKP